MQSSNPNLIRIPSYSQSLKVYNRRWRARSTAQEPADLRTASVGLERSVFDGCVERCVAVPGYTINRYHQPIPMRGSRPGDGHDQNTDYGGGSLGNLVRFQTLTGFCLHFA